MSIVPRTKSDLEKLIADKVEESNHLEYKDARALVVEGEKNPKADIAKDVSAMANSAGGLIIYGIKEYKIPEKKHLPEEITPIDRTEFSREWLEQVINSNICPKIEGLSIHPIPLDKDNEVVYVVEIPQSTTAHQNTIDGRYYRRYNFLAVWISDYEIRDIMNRAKHPVIELEFEIEEETYEIKESFPMPVIPNTFPMQEKRKEYRTDITLRIFPKNTGSVYAQYINYFVHLPDDIVNDDSLGHLKKPAPGLVEFYGENTYRDVVDFKSSPMGGGYPKYGPSRFDPVLPGLRGRSEKLRLSNNPNLDEREITWKVYADNARPLVGSKKLNEITVIEKKEE